MTNVPSPPDPTEPLVAAMTETLLARYPGRFTPEEVEHIRNQVSTLLAATTRLRAYPLTNADEPDYVFRAFRGEE